MPDQDLRSDAFRTAAQQVLGYLNLSSGADAPVVYAALSDCYAALEAEGRVQDGPLWQRVLRRLGTELDRLHNRGESAFADCTQARGVLALLADHILPGYLEFHADLLFHQRDEVLFGPFFVARAAQATLRAGPPWEDARRITTSAIRTLCDYIGYRPLATLETRKTEPYAHEYVAVVPLYLRDVGVAAGPYAELVEAALDHLRQADPRILEEAHFRWECFDELAFDPRAFDFDHPINQRPNYQFGEWDPGRVDERGQYRRFVVQQTTLDILRRWVESRGGAPRQERLLEASAVLAGTMLMGSGISGWGPAAHDSGTTLGTLVIRIARYRDAFYEGLLGRLSGPTARRLEEEARRLRQPFGAVRQHLNLELGRRRAAQREHAYLARAYARMGWGRAACKEVERVLAPSARFLCQLDCWLTEAHSAIDLGCLDEAATYLPLIRNLLDRGIECGALIDPWNFLGLDARFPLFPAMEDSVPDERADELIGIIHQFLHLHARIWTEAAARHESSVVEAVREHFARTARWWRQYAAHEVESLDAVDPEEAYRAAEHVADAMERWYDAGAATGDVAFWAPHAAVFDSPHAYAAVIRALIEREDFRASQGLLFHWLSRADEVPLSCEDDSFFHVVERWMLQFHEATREGNTSAWPAVSRFFDCLEANAEAYWDPPRWEVETGGHASTSSREAIEPEDDDPPSLFDAAYEGVVFRDSADDGVDGALDDGFEDETDDHAWMHETDRIKERIVFLTTLAQLWKLVGVSPHFLRHDDPDEVAGTLTRWLEQIGAKRGPLNDLVDTIASLPLGSVGHRPATRFAYDRRRVVRDTLLDLALGAVVEIHEALHFLAAGAIAFAGAKAETVLAGIPMEHDEIDIVLLYAAVMKGDRAGVQRRWRALEKSLLAYPLLYVPAARGGNPHEIVRARLRQRAIRHLLMWLPRLGMLAEACRLVETARRMEEDHPVGAGAVTEFDDLFRTGFRAVVESVVAAAAGEGKGGEDEWTMQALEQFTEALLGSWLAHSRTLRLSVLDRISKRRWSQLVDFIRTYGADLFTQEFLGLGNLRAIVHHGVKRWLQSLLDDPGEPAFQLVEDLASGAADLEEASSLLSIILEAVIENMGEYRDYNQLTTQSDRGDMLYTFLDFIRLRNEYDRIGWKLTPIVLAHEVLVRHRRFDLASLWRQATQQRTRRQAREFLKRLAHLQQEHAMSIPSIQQRLEERFVRPMIVDQTRALVRPAMEEARAGKPPKAFGQLQANVEMLMAQRCGSSWDMPNWLVALEEEIDNVRRHNRFPCFDTVLAHAVPQQTLTREEIERQRRAITSAPPP